MLRSSSLQTDPELKDYVISRLKLYWPPAAIAGRWKLEHPDRSLSASTIYRHINRHLLPDIDRKHHLRRRGKRRNDKDSNYNTIHPDRIIPQWPVEIRDRLRIGDWEGDSIVGGRGKGAAVTLVDRRSGFLCGFPVLTRSADETRHAIVKALDGMPVLSLSLDNGSEFAEFRQLEKQLLAPIYFAQPHKRLDWRSPFEVFFGVALD